MKDSEMRREKTRKVNEKWKTMQSKIELSVMKMLNVYEVNSETEDNEYERQEEIKKRKTSA